MNLALKCQKNYSKLWNKLACHFIGEYLIEDLVRLPVEVEYASEFRYRNPHRGLEDVVIALSQSGETADTLAALGTIQRQMAVTMVSSTLVPHSTNNNTYILISSPRWLQPRFYRSGYLLTIMAFKFTYRVAQFSNPDSREIIIESEKSSKIKQVLEKDEQQNISLVDKGTPMPSISA